MDFSLKQKDFSELKILSKQTTHSKIENYIKQNWSER